MRKIAIFIVAGALLLLCAAPALANGIPKLPHAFYGNVIVNGVPASDSTQVSATVDIGEIISTQNPVTTVGGKYGVGSSYLLVQGYDIPDGATVTFHVTNANGTTIGGTATFEAGGGPTPKNLSVTIAPPEEEPADNGAVIGPGAMYIETNLFGTTADFRISDTGEILKSIEATSEDGKLTLYLPKGTIALDKNGKPLESLEAAVDESPPDPPEGAHIIGLPYIFQPSGATFDPPLTLVWSYDPEALPEGVAEEDLVIAYYIDGEWVELVGVVDPVTKTITASVSHFTTIAIIGFPPAAFTLSSLAISPAEVAPAEKVNISISVVNTGAREGSYTVVLKINGVKEAEKAVRIAPGESQSVSFSVAKEAGSYSVAIDGLSGSFTVAPAPPPPPPTPTPAPPTPTVTPPPPAPTPTPTPAPAPAPPTPPGFNWWALWGAVIAGVVIVAGLLIFRWVRRKAG